MNTCGNFSGSLGLSQGKVEAQKNFSASIFEKSQCFMEIEVKLISCLINLIFSKVDCNQTVPFYFSSFFSFQI